MRAVAAVTMMRATSIDDYVGENGFGDAAQTVRMWVNEQNASALLRGNAPSEYARTNSTEFFAETFAAWYMGTRGGVTNVTPAVRNMAKFLDVMQERHSRSNTQYRTINPRTPQDERIETFHRHVELAASMGFANPERTVRGGTAK